MTTSLAELSRRLTSVPDGKYLLGLSGGADSVALLLMLLPEIRGGRIRAEAVHVNHGLRGEASGEDARFAASLCERENIPFHLYRADLRGRRDENTAREERYRCFRECLRETGADGIILAHHADDLAETMLMRLLRGTGPDGLGAMRPETEAMGMRILRPMLTIGREEIREALRKDGIPWREDESNGDPAYLRNALRQEIMPRLEKLAPGAGLKMARTALMLGEDSLALRQEAQRILDAAAEEDRLDTDRLKDLPPALTYRVLRMWAGEIIPERKQHELTAEQTERLAGLLRQERGTVNLPGGIRVIRGKRWLYADRGEEFTGTKFASEEIPWKDPETAFRGITLRRRTDGVFPGDGKHSQAVPAGFAGGCVLRTRRQGDRIRPFGSSGTRKLQDYLTDRGIEAFWRDRIPLLCRGSEVLLAAGVGAGNIPRMNPEEQTEMLEWSGEMPWTETEKT